MERTVDTPRRKKVITYRYIATTAQGERVDGTIKATSEAEAERLIVEKGHYPTNVEVAPSMFSLEEALPSLFQIKPRDIVIFSRQLATLLRAGISLLPALEILQGQVASSRAFKSSLTTIINDIRSGFSFSHAISKHPRVFSDIYCRTIAIGEESGNMEVVLERMADFQEKSSYMAQKVKKALTYPIMVLGVGLLVVLLMVTTVLPQLMGMFTAMNVELPLPTKILLAITDFASTNQLYILIVLAVLAALVLWLAKQPAGRRLLDRLRLTVPIMGPPALMLELGRFARTMAVLVGAGVKLHEIMDMAPQSTGNRYFRDALVQVREGLLLGDGLSHPMSQIDIFPPLMVQMVAVGEESNTLDFTMGVVADFYDATAEEKTMAMVGMIGPISTIGISLLVGFIALAVIMPMYSLTGAFG